MTSLTEARSIRSQRDTAVQALSEARSQLLNLYFKNGASLPAEAQAAYDIIQAALDAMPAEILN